MKNEDNLTLNDGQAEVKFFYTQKVGDRLLVQVIRTSYDELMSNWDDLEGWVERIQQAYLEREELDAIRNAQLRRRNRQGDPGKERTKTGKKRTKTG